MLLPYPTLKPTKEKKVNGTILTITNWDLPIIRHKPMTKP
jgi:hypothetical protein